MRVSNLQKVYHLLCIIFYGFGRVISSTDHEYSVSIITDPRQGPFRIYQFVNFSCVVEPAPPDHVTYQWRSVESIYGGSTSTQQNWPRYYHYDYLHYCWYFCDVLLNDTVLGSANRIVEVQGSMYTTDPVVRSFNYGGRLQLNVNFSSQYYYARYITSLAWYHNGTRIFSGRKFTITDNDTLLSITDMEPSDAGEYTVRINSINVSDYLLWGHNDPQCDALVLPLLEFLAVHAPVTFAVQESCLQEYNLLSIATITQFFTESHALIELSVPSQYFLRYPMSWYRNGNSLSNDAIYNLTTSGQTSSLVINLNDTDVAAGSYVGISYLLVNDLYYGQFGSCSLYYYYLSSDLGLGVILSSISYWNVVFQRVPSSVLLQFQQSVLTKDESTLIECNAIGGEPRDFYNLTMWKDSQQLDKVTGDYLSYHTQTHPYGAYTCAVGDIMNSSILYERAHFQLLMKIQCRDLRNPSLSMAVSEVFSTACPSCVDVYASNIENVQVNCTGSGEFTYLTADLVYSDPEGRITASTLLDMLLVWMLSQDNPSIMADGLRVALSKQCPPQLNSVTGSACVNLLYSNDDEVVSRSAVSTSLSAATFFGGLATGVIIMVIGYGLIWCIRRLKFLKHTQKESNKDIAMATNQAYETVEIDTRYGVGNRQGEMKEQDEVIYETPAV